MWQHNYQIPAQLKVYEEIWDQRTGDYRGRRERVKLSTPARIRDFDSANAERFVQSRAEDYESLSGKWYEATPRTVMFMLRLSLAAVFFWFGLLKVADVSPVTGILKNSFPFIAATPYIELLGLAEILIAIGLIINRLASQTVVLMTLHLLGTLSVALISPALVFAPAFPVLTMEGEFLLKNLVLIAAGLVIAFSRER